MKVEVCGGAKCTLLGSLTILDQVEELANIYPEAGISVDVIKCTKACGNGDGPIIYIDGKILECATSQMVMSKVMESIEVL
ncbi:MAG: NAD(P)H-dependent oxidoreductase subunit E [Filifactoraceae bacterium]